MVRGLSCVVVAGLFAISSAANAAVDVAVTNELVGVDAGAVGGESASVVVDTQQLLNELAAELAATAGGDVGASAPVEPAAPELPQPDRNPELSTPHEAFAPFSSSPGSSMGGGGGGSGSGGAAPLALAPFVDHILADPLLGRLAIADTLSAPAEPVFSMLRPPRA